MFARKEIETGSLSVIRHASGSDAFAVPFDLPEHDRASAAFKRGYPNAAAGTERDGLKPGSRFFEQNAYPAAPDEDCEGPDFPSGIRNEYMQFQANIAVEESDPGMNPDIRADPKEFVVEGQRCFACEIGRRR